MTNVPDDGRHLHPSAMKHCTLSGILLSALMLGWIASAHAATPFIDPMFDFPVKKDIVFANGEIGHPEKTGEMELKLDLYRPVATDELPKTLPAMIFVFGGGFKKGSKNIDYIRDLCEHYAKRGYVTAAIEYRLIEHNPTAVSNPLPGASEVGDIGRVVTAAVKDTANAIHWLRKSAADLKIDPQRIGVGGVSAGALNALFAGYAEADVLGTNAEVAAVVCLMAPPGLEPSLIDANDPPTFFGHGEKDKLALMTPLYIQQLNEAKVYHEVYVAPGLAHRISSVLDTVIDGKTIRDHSVAFCFKALKLSDLVKELAAPAKAP